MPSAEAWRYRRLRAPEAGAALCEPPLNSVAQMLQANQAAREKPASRWCAALAREARPALLFAAAQHTLRYRDCSSLLGRMNAPLLLAGHQPELFHAGVWFKNFVLSSLAREQGAIGINLIIDNDTPHAVAIRVPAGTRGSPRVATIPFDAEGFAIPYEERELLDAALFDSFPERVRETAQAWLPNLILDQLWPLAQAARSHTNQLGLMVSEARHRLEGDWGLQTLEVPLSTVVAQPTFHRFFMKVLEEGVQFHEQYNACLHDYRYINQVRNKAQPMPDLAVDADWLELPLWVWSRGQPTRRRLFARPLRGGWELTDRAAWRGWLPARNADDSGGLETLAVWEKQGVKIRPRALFTTLYARLILGDLFIHGIGGAKYDELTDALLRRHFGIDPPGYLTATATWRLPLDYAWAARDGVTRDDVTRAAQQLRDYEYHAERFANGALATRKAMLLGEIPPRGSRQAWHAEITEMNRDLAAMVIEQRQQAERELAALRERHRISQLLGSREFSFALFPEAALRTALQQLAERRTE